MTNRFHAKTLLHLGDDYRDAQELLMAGYNVRCVPGLWCPEYQNSRISRRLVEAFDGLTVACAHADKDLRHTERAAAIVLTGHTHVAQIAVLGRSLYVNPGHLKLPVSRNEPASYAVVEIDPEDVRATIHEVASHSVRFETRIPRTQLAG